MNHNSIFIVQKFIGAGYTRGHIATMHQITEWRNIRAFTEEHQAEKYMESLQAENETCQYSIQEVPLDVPMSGKLYFPTDDRILC